MNILDNISSIAQGMFGEVAKLQTDNLPKDLNIPIVNRYDSQKDNCLDMMNKMLIQQKQIASAIEKKKLTEEEVKKKQEEAKKSENEKVTETNTTQGQTVSATEQVAKDTAKKSNDLVSQWKQVQRNAGNEIKKFQQSINQAISKLDTTVKEILGMGNNFGIIPNKQQTYTTIIPERDEDPRFYMYNENFNISHPILEVEFLGEYGKLHASPELPTEKLEEGQLDGDIVSLTIDRRMGQDAPSFNMNLVWRDSWYYQLASNDLVKIRLKRPATPLYRNPTQYEPIIPSKEPNVDVKEPMDDSKAPVTDTTLEGNAVPKESYDNFGNNAQYFGPDYNKITEKDSKQVISAKREAQDRWIASNVIQTKKASDVQATVTDTTKQADTATVTKDTVMGSPQTEEKKQDVITTGSNAEFQYDELGNIIGYNGLQDNIIVAGDDNLVVNAKQLAQKKLMSSTAQATTVKADDASSSSTVADNEMKAPIPKNDTTSDDYSEEDANIIFVGMIDDIRKDLDWSSGNPRRVVSISGRGICKALLQFDMDQITRLGARNYLLNSSKIEQLLSPLSKNNTMVGTYATARAMPAEAVLSLLKIYARKSGKYNATESTENDEEEIDEESAKSAWRVEQITTQVEKAKETQIKGEKIWDPTQYSFFDYKYGSKVLPLQELFDFRYEDFRSLKANVGFAQHLGDNKQLMNTNTGCIWNMLKTLANLPFNEFYWESYFGKEQLILRNTPFIETLWNKLPCTYIPDTEVLSDSSGRSDYETYTCFVTDQPVTGGSLNLRSVAPPCFNTALLGKYGLRTKLINSSYIFKPLRDEIKDVQLDLNGKMVRNGNTYEGKSEELYNKEKDKEGYHQLLQGVRIQKGSMEAVAEGRTEETKDKDKNKNTTSSTNNPVADNNNYGSDYDTESSNSTSNPDADEHLLNNGMSIIENEDGSSVAKDQNGIYYNRDQSGYTNTDDDNHGERTPISQLYEESRLQEPEPLVDIDEIVSKAKKAYLGR